MKSIHFIKKFRVILFVICLGLAMSACKKFVEIDPPIKQLTNVTVFESDATAEATIIDMYGKFCSQSNFPGGGASSMTYFGCLLSDETLYYGNSAGANYLLYVSNILPNHAVVTSFWGSCYNFIYSMNATIEGLEASTKITPSVKKRLIGEAKFIRAFCHFYLVVLYGDVPYITTTDYRQNAVVSRMPVNQVYEKIIEDLKDAENRLPDNYLTIDRVRVNKWAATALLARVYLYAGNWASAEQTATSVIDNTGLYGLTTLNNVFLKNSREAIFQLFREGSNPYTWDGLIFVLTAKPTRVSLTPNFYNAFEAGDARKTNWTNSITVTGITYYFPFKYKEYFNNATGKEYSMVLRLAEQYLIRAEARAQQNKLTGVNSAESDINTIRNRAGLPNTTAVTQTGLLDVISNERKAELFTEWGHRWFDLKRMGKADAVLAPVKPGWQPTDVLWPIPESEIQRNPNLTQNPGY